MRKWKLADDDPHRDRALWSRRGFYIHAHHWGDAASEISVLYGPEEDGFSWQPTPYQVADARHSPREAAALIA